MQVFGGIENAGVLVGQPAVLWYWESVLFQHILGEVFLCHACDHAGEHQQCNQVRDRHQAVQRIRDIPHQCAGSDSADDADKREDDLINCDNSFVVVSQITPAVLAVIRP